MKIKPIVRTKEPIEVAPSISTATTARLASIISGRGKVPFLPSKACRPSPKVGEKKA